MPIPPFAPLLAGCAEVPPAGAPGAADGGLPFDEAHVLVVPDAEGLSRITSDGARTLTPWTALLGGPCEACEGQGATPDGDGLLFTFAVDQVGGGVLRLDGDDAPQWQVDGLWFPHDALRDPADGALIVAEAGAGRLVWLDGAGAELRAMGGFAVPNGMHRFGHDRLLVSSRGRGPGAGNIVLVELRPGERPLVRWVLDELDLPHAPRIHLRDGRYWLSWAEAGGDGAVGLAVTDDPTRAPRPVARLVPPHGAPFGLLRGAELTRDGWLLLTDSAGPHGGRVLRAPLPALDPEADAGDVTLEHMEELIGGLPRPFEGWLAPAPTRLSRSRRAARAR